MALVPGTTTDWDDIQVKLGNFAPREHVPSRNDVEASLVEAAEQVEAFAMQSMRTLERLCEHDGGNDEELLEFERIRNRRLEELKTRSSKPFGSVGPPVSHAAFTTEVTEASNHYLVVCHLMSHRSIYCSEMNKVIEHLAKKYPEIKFCTGVASEVIVGEFPESNLPYVVVYSGGACVAQIPRATTAAVVAAVNQHRSKGHDSDASQSESEEDHRGIPGMVINRVSRNYRDNDVDDDREYSSTFLNRHVLRRTH
jgi:hypothetical protein